MPELEDEKYYGELHFIGKKFAFQLHQALDFLHVLREGISGIQQLELACEKNDPQLKGINYFIGISKLVPKSLTKLGFDVMDPPKKNKYIFKDPVCYLRNIFGFEHLEWLEHRKSRMCVATRESLIANKEAIDRFANRIGSK